MAKDSNIQWTDHTWNIARGCSKVDADCKFCYMYRESLNGTRYEPKHVLRTKTVFNLPLKIKDTTSKVWNGPPLIFTSSLTDFFHEDIDSYRAEAWDIIRRCPHLIFQILTKRPERIIDHLPDGWGNGWDNVIIGTSVGSNESEQRVRDLIRASILGPINKTFLSLEPLHGAISFLNEYYFKAKAFDVLHPTTRTKMIEFIDWVIVGGESGNENGKYRYRECKLEWIELIVSQCAAARVPVFVKQLGTHLSKTLHLSDRHGGVIEEFPEHLRLRQMPIFKEVSNGVN